MYSSLYAVAMGECGDSVWVRVQPDGSLRVEEVTADCCDPTEALAIISEGRVVLADTVPLVEEVALSQQGYLVAHPITEDGAYFVDASGRLLYR
jgi:hypothetical protein